MVRSNVKTACEREELKAKGQMSFGMDERERKYVSFMLVAATVLALLPSSIKVIISS